MFLLGYGKEKAKDDGAAAIPWASWPLACFWLMSRFVVLLYPVAKLSTTIHCSLLSVAWTRGRSGENVKNVSNQKLRGSRLCRYTFRRLRLAPGESMPWHRDPYHRTLVILGVDALTIEYRDLSQCLTLQPRQLD